MSPISHVEVGLFAFGGAFRCIGKCYKNATIPVYGAESLSGDYSESSENKTAGRRLVDLLNCRIWLACAILAP